MIFFQGEHPDPGLVRGRHPGASAGIPFPQSARHSARPGRIDRGHGPGPFAVCPWADRPDLRPPGRRAPGGRRHRAGDQRADRLPSSLPDLRADAFYPGRAGGPRTRRPAGDARKRPEDRLPRRRRALQRGRIPWILRGQPLRDEDLARGAEGASRPAPEINRPCWPQAGYARAAITSPPDPFEAVRDPPMSSTPTCG